MPGIYKTAASGAPTPEIIAVLKHVAATHPVLAKALFGSSVGAAAGWVAHRLRPHDEDDDKSSALRSVLTMAALGGIAGAGRGFLSRNQAPGNPDGDLIDMGKGQFAIPRSKARRMYLEDLNNSSWNNSLIDRETLVAALRSGRHVPESPHGPNLLRAMLADSDSPVFGVNSRGDIHPVYRDGPDGSLRWDNSRTIVHDDMTRRFLSALRPYSWEHDMAALNRQLELEPRRGGIKKQSAARDEDTPNGSAWNSVRDVVALGMAPGSLGGKYMSYRDAKKYSRIEEIINQWNDQVARDAAAGPASGPQSFGDWLRSGLYDPQTVRSLQTNTRELPFAKTPGGADWGRMPAHAPRTVSPQKHMFGVSRAFKGRRGTAIGAAAGTLAMLLVKLLSGGESAVTSKHRRRITAK